jgi:hypothetical protein
VHDSSVMKHVWFTISVLASLLFSRSLLYADRPFFASHAQVGNSITSPDKKIKISLRLLDENADDFPTEIQVHTSTETLTAIIHFGLNPEVLWSADSKAFTVTGSSGGANGPYHSDAFIIKPGRLIHVPLTALVRTAFGHPVKCGWPESPNVAAIRWIDNSRTVLVAAEVVNHSNCDSFGTFKTFVVDLDTKQIVKRYGQLQVKRLYGSDLGIELKDANDTCIRDPESCFVLYNHPELK